MHIDQSPGAPGPAAIAVGGGTTPAAASAVGPRDAVSAALARMAPTEDVVRRRAFGALLRALNREMIPR